MTTFLPTLVDISDAGLTDAQSGLLLSLAGNLRISQVVNPSKGCIMELADVVYGDGGEVTA